MPYLYAMDFIEVLKKKHAAGGYKDMVRRYGLRMMLLMQWQVLIKGCVLMLCIYAGHICGSL